MRIVLDTNVVVSALLWGGPPRLLMQAAYDRHIGLFTSAPMLAELLDILARPKFSRKVAASLLSIDQIVDGYVALAAPVRPAPTPRIAPDPDDDMALGTALTCGASCIVTGDKPLLGVGEYHGIRIVTVAQALIEIDASRRAR